MQSRELALLILGAVLLMGVGIAVGSVMAGDVLQDPERPIQVDVNLGAGDGPLPVQLAGGLRLEMVAPPATATPDLKPANVIDNSGNVASTQSGYVYAAWSTPANAAGLVGFQARYGSPVAGSPWVWSVQEVLDATANEWETAATCAATCYVQVGAIYETGIAYADAVEAAPEP